MNGWTLELLNSLVTRGKIIAHPHFDKDEESGFGGYYIPEAGTQMNIPELMKHVTSVHRAFDDHPEDTDEEFIARMLW
jgi:hypothetical protein